MSVQQILASIERNEQNICEPTEQPSVHVRSSDELNARVHKAVGTGGVFLKGVAGFALFIAVLKFSVVRDVSVGDAVDPKTEITLTEGE